LYGSLASCLPWESQQTCSVEFNILFQLSVIFPHDGKRSAPAMRLRLMHNMRFMRFAPHAAYARSFPDGRDIHGC
jgi:hypothetical protein